MNERKSTEEQVERIEEIHGSEVLGYQGEGRGEHSGENAPKEPGDLRGELADNTKKDIQSD